MKSHPFNWEHYRHILAVGQDSGYRYIGFDEQPTGKSIYLRHDIDNDVAIAHRMAAIEHEMGIKSTYLVLTRSANYNPAERTNILMLREMSDMGHEIGLHFSLLDHPARYDKHDLGVLIKQDADFLGGLLDREVKIFSMHNPTEGVQFQIDVPGMINTYANCFYKDIFYTSESNMNWRRGCPCEILANDEHQMLQILIHPLSFADELTSDEEVLIHFLWLKMSELLEYNGEQNRVTREQEISIRNALDKLYAKVESS